MPYDQNDPRLYTELIKILKEAGVKGVLVDMVFPYCREGREELCAAFAEEEFQAGNVYFPVILAHSGAHEEKPGKNPNGPWSFLLRIGP